MNVYQSTHAKFEEVVKNAEHRVQQAVIHGEQQLQNVAQQLQAGVRQSEDRIAKAEAVTEAEFGKHAAISSKHEQHLHDHEHRVQIVEVQITQLKESVKACEKFAATFLNPNLLKPVGVQDDAKDVLAHLGSTVNLLKANVKLTDGQVTGLVSELTALKFKIETNEGSSSGGNFNPGYDNNKTKNRGYLPLKELIPKKFNDRIEDWIKWREDILAFMDITNTGMKAFLEEVSREKKDPISEDWIRKRTDIYLRKSSNR